MLNFGVRTKSLFLPTWPSITAMVLCRENPMATEKKAKNIPVYFTNCLNPAPLIDL